MAIVAPVITAYFDMTAQGGSVFLLDDPIKGALDNATYVLAGEIATTIDGFGYDINVNRGRDRELDEIPAGTARYRFRNATRDFDPSNTAGVFYPNLIPGKRYAASIYGVTIFDGSAEDLEDDYDASKRTDASVLCIDALGALARKDFDEWTTVAGQTAGPRITASLDRNEVVYPGGRDLDAGVSTLQADLVTWGSNVLNYLQLVAKSDLGRLFASRTNVLTYRDRLSSVGDTVRATFADDGTGLAFHAVKKRSAAELLYTRVSIDREGGVAQTATDAAAIEEFGVRNLPLPGLLLDSDIQSDNLADWLLNIYKDPEDRIAALTVYVSGYASQADQALVASLDIGDLVRVVWTPAGVGSALDQTLVVEGVAHQIMFDAGHVMTLSLSDSFQDNVFILDDATFGLLDTGGRLAY